MKAISLLRGALLCLLISLCSLTSFAQSIDTTVTANGFTLVSNDTDATSYQWLDCDNGFAPLAGDTNRTFTASTAGNYAVIVYENGDSGTSVCYYAGITATALHLDGSNDYAQVSANPVPTSGDFTTTVWAKRDPGSLGAYRNMFSQLGGTHYYMGLTPTNQIRAGDDWWTGGPAGPSDYNWHHYAIVKTDTETYVYLDGSLVGTRGYAISNPGASNQFRIGNQFTGSEYWKGGLDDIRIYNRALTQEEIQLSINCQVDTSH